ncbi:MAG: biotin attachment protein [Planctomycetes bacterium]|nr:biotin attachment protein [Planctomycetota bacterium]
MRKPIIVPDLGVESAVLNLWLVELGELVYAGDRMVELLAEEATFDVSAPATGKLVEKTARLGESLHAGQVLGHVEEG